MRAILESGAKSLYIYIYIYIYIFMTQAVKTSPFGRTSCTDPITHLLPPLAKPTHPPSPFFRTTPHKACSARTHEGEKRSAHYKGPGPFSPTLLPISESKQKTKTHPLHEMPAAQNEQLQMRNLIGPKRAAPANKKTTWLRPSTVAVGSPQKTRTPHLGCV